MKILGVLAMLYSATFLLNLKSVCDKVAGRTLSSCTLARIYELGINRSYTAYRRKRASKQVFKRIRKIQSRVSDRKQTVCGRKNTDGRNTSNLRALENLGRLSKIVTNVKCGLLNARSVCNKLPNFHEYMNHSKLDLCCVTETWIREDDSQTSSMLAPEGFSSEILCRKNQTGGGLAVVYNSKLKIHKCSTPELKSMECIHIKITQTMVPAIDLLLIYRKDEIAFLTFIDELTTLLEAIITNTGNLYLMGDFNIKVNNTEDPQTQTFMDFLECFDLQNNVNFPTHLSGKTLDLVISRIDDTSITSFAQGEMIADHHAIEFTMRAVVDLKISKTRTVRSMKNIDQDKLNEDLISVVAKITSTDNLFEAVELYNCELTKILDHHAPVKSKKLPDKPSPPWLTSKITNLIRK